MDDRIVINVEDNFPSNSHKNNSDEKKERVVEKVTVNKVVETKPGFGRMFKEVFSPDNLKGILGFVGVSVIIPALKTMIYDAGTKGLERAMWGDEPVSHSTGRGPINYNMISTNKNYGRMSSPTHAQPIRTDPTHFIVQTRGEAEMVLDNLAALIETYGHATVADYYQLIGKTGSYTDNKWGWTSLRGAHVVRDRNHGYSLSLPKAEPV